MAPLSMPLNDLKGHIYCLKPFHFPYLVKQHEFTNIARRAVPLQLQSFLLYIAVKNMCLNSFVLNAADRHALQFTINRVVYRLFGAMSKDLYMDKSAYILVCL